MAIPRVVKAFRDRLPPKAVQRLRLVKWAMTGPPTGVDLTPKRQFRPEQPVAPADPDAPAVLQAGKTRLDQRRECVLAGVPADGLFLEIGPAHQPTLARRDGYRTRNADHLDRDGLVEKYRDQDGVDVEVIEDVDYVLTPGVPLASCIAERFDLVLASHVLEHSVSLIDFVNDCAELLKPGGALAFIVPDKRFCFDRFRDRSPLSSIIDTAAARRRTHSAGTLTEVALYTAQRRGSIAWTPDSRGAYEWVHGLDDARRLAAEADDVTYMDVHRWVFTPHHLRLLLNDLADTGHISVRESAFHGTVGFEFFVELRADGTGPQLPREELVARADAEQHLDGPVTFRQVPGR